MPTLLEEVTQSTSKIKAQYRRPNYSDNLNIAISGIHTFNNISDK